MKNLGDEVEYVPPEVDDLGGLDVVELVHREPDGHADVRVDHLLLLVALRLDQFEHRLESILRNCFGRTYG
jgi:hypothetical protein